MGRVSTDDAARRQEFKWLGTPDVPTPFEARGSAWGLGIALSAAFSVVAYLATPFMALLPGPFIVTFVVRGIAAVLIGIAAAVPVVRWVGKRVSPERRIRYHRRVLLDEIAAHRPNETATTTVDARNTLPLADAYPDLKAPQNFAELQQSLETIEEEIQMARRYYNGAARDLNVKVESFPSNLIAGPFGFAKAPFFEITNEADRAVPSVKF